MNDSIKKGQEASKKSADKPSSNPEISPEVRRRLAWHAFKVVLKYLLRDRFIITAIIGTLIVVAISNLVQDMFRFLIT